MENLIIEIGGQEVSAMMAGVFDDEKTPTEAATSGEGYTNIN